MVGGVSGWNSCVRLRLIAVEIFPKSPSLAEAFPAKCGQMFKGGRVLALQFFFGGWTEAIEVGLHMNGR